MKGCTNRTGRVCTCEWTRVVFITLREERKLKSRKNAKSVSSARTSEIATESNNEKSPVAKRNPRYLRTVDARNKILSRHARRSFITFCTLDIAPIVSRFPARRRVVQITRLPIVTRANVTSKVDDETAGGNLQRNLILRHVRTMRNGSRRGLKFYVVLVRSLQNPAMLCNNLIVVDR